MSENNDRFSVLLEEGKRFCNSVGLHDDLLLDIYQSDSDWAFILKIDALLEISVKEVVTRSLKIELKGKTAAVADLQKFVGNLSVIGKTSLLELIQMTGCPKDTCDFIKAIRILRNVFAHNIKHIDDSLLTVIKSRKDMSSLLKSLSPVEQYDEKKIVELIEKDGKLFRFGILDATLRFLMLEYHAAIK